MLCARLRCVPGGLKAPASTVSSLSGISSSISLNTVSDEEHTRVKQELAALQERQQKTEAELECEREERHKLEVKLAELQTKVHV